MTENTVQLTVNEQNFVDILHQAKAFAEAVGYGPRLDQRVLTVEGDTTSALLACERMLRSQGILAADERIDQPTAVALIKKYAPACTVHEVNARDRETGAVTSEIVYYLWKSSTWANARAAADKLVSNVRVKVGFVLPTRQARTAPVKAAKPASDQNSL